MPYKFNPFLGSLDLVNPAVDTSGFVPYTGATSDVNLGSHDLSVADEVYGSGWNGSLEVPTKNAVYDKIETLLATATAATTYLKLDTSNAPLTGNLNISKADPTYSRTDSGNSYTAYDTYADTNNLWKFVNKVDTTITATDQIPTMSSNTAPSGVASASSEYNATTTAAWCAMNNNLSDMWMANPSSYPNYLQYQFTSGKVATGYSMTPRQDGVNYNQAPYNWTFQGSNNGSSWTTLDTQTASNLGASAAKQTFNFSNSTSYTYYRWYCTGRDYGNGGWCSLSEVEIYTGTSSTDEVTWLQSQKSGVTDVYGLHTLGNSTGRAVLNGESLRFQIAGTERASFDTTGLFTGTRGLMIDGSSDIIQSRIQGHSTQTSKLTTWETSAASVVADMSVGGIHGLAGLRPMSDSTTALQIFKADGSTNILTIDTTNSRVGIGATGAPTATYLQLGSSAFSQTNRVDFSVFRADTSTSGSEATLGFQVTAAPTGTSTASLRGVHADVGIASGISQTMTGAETIGYLANFQGRSAVTLGNNYGFKANTQFTAAIAGTITSNYGFFVETPTMNSGTITTNYALYINDPKPSGVTTAYGIYQAGTSSRNYFGSRVGLGTSNPQAKLEILGVTDEVQLQVIANGTQTNNLQTWKSSGGTVLKSITGAGKDVNTLPVTLKGYTVATLPAGVVGDLAYVTDATAPTYLGALTGGGAVVCKVFYNGSAWVSA